MQVRASRMISRQRNLCYMMRMTESRRLIRDDKQPYRVTLSLLRSINSHFSDVKYKMPAI